MVTALVLSMPRSRFAVSPGLHGAQSSRQLGPVGYIEIELDKRDPTRGRNSWRVIRGSGERRW
ncbi:hypothetical protein NITHO_280012 [Nitrolancea hollandica Lb]|uniref:Uncharacterized protein n=1 Tax=Nitrolancea hollandica Lb TaxID=1129897 RepID=I4EGQ7_9BACT|nr:hypothetical protein NITHO_280012 [Nitrolancea hollandica Lb]